MYDEKNTGSNLPAQVEIYAAQVRAIPCRISCGHQADLSAHSLTGRRVSLPLHGQGRWLRQQDVPVPGDQGARVCAWLYHDTPTHHTATQALLNPERMMSFLEEKVKTLGTSACPPYHLAVVIGGLSAEQTLKTAKYASARYYDNLHTRRVVCSLLLRSHPCADDPSLSRIQQWQPRRAGVPGLGAGERGAGDDATHGHRRPVWRQVLLPRRQGHPPAPPRRLLPRRHRGVLQRRPAGAGQDHG